MHPRKEGKKKEKKKKKKKTGVRRAHPRVTVFRFVVEGVLYAAHGPEEGVEVLVASEDDEGCVRTAACCGGGYVPVEGVVRAVSCAVVSPLLVDGLDRGCVAVGGVGVGDEVVEGDDGGEEESDVSRCCVHGWLAGEAVGEGAMRWSPGLCWWKS